MKNETMIERMYGAVKSDYSRAALAILGDSVRLDRERGPRAIFQGNEYRLGNCGETVVYDTDTFSANVFVKYVGDTTIFDIELNAAAPEACIEIDVDNGHGVVRKNVSLEGVKHFKGVLCDRDQASNAKNGVECMANIVKTFDEGEKTLCKESAVLISGELQSKAPTATKTQDTAQGQ